jgi:methyltransferase (TIGR00027 family)
MRKNRPSRTAPKVGATILYVAQDPRYAALLPAGLTEETERLLLASGALKPWHLRLARTRWYRWFVEAMVSKMAPGHLVYLALRKRFVQDEVESALAAGASQVLIIGAGMDTLCLRLAPDHADVTFVEVDHPASQGMKREAVDRISAGRPNLHLLPVDLEASDLAETLAAHPGWRGDARTMVVAEGVLEYLAAETVVRVFDAVARATGPGSRFLFAYALQDETGRVRIGKVTRLQGAMMKASGEGLRWGVREGDLETFLEAQGYRPFGSPERVDLSERYLAPAGLEGPLGGIEFVALAEPVASQD